MVPRCMSSTTSATYLATQYQDQGLELFHQRRPVPPALIASAMARKQIQLGKQDIVFAGGGEELDWTHVGSVRRACRAHVLQATMIRRNGPRGLMTSDRDGFVISGGGGILVLEELEHARARGAKIYGEVGPVMAPPLTGPIWLQPSGEGARALHAHGARSNGGGRRQSSKVDYINTHGTADTGGRSARKLHAIRECFWCRYTDRYHRPNRLTGHSQGRDRRQHESIYSLLMMRK